MYIHEDIKFWKGILMPLFIGISPFLGGFLFIKMDGNDEYFPIIYIVSLLVSAMICIFIIKIENNKVLKNAIIKSLENYPNVKNNDRVIMAEVRYNYKRLYLTDNEIIKALERDIEKKYFTINNNDIKITVEGIKKFKLTCSHNV